MISAKNFSVELKNARPARKTTNDMKTAIPSIKKSTFTPPLMTVLTDSITAAIGLKTKKNFPDDGTIDVG